MKVPAESDMAITSSLEELQTDEQRRILDTVAQVRKCGLESILSLPQLVVCGDQSAGKSSVLEALTEIPFPRNDNLCTRFATEIILRRAPNNSLTINIIPDNQRPSHEQTKIAQFEEVITDFNDLPKVMEMAMQAMGMNQDSTSDSRLGAFARDVLRITIEGPTRPQLTLVDIPGLIANATKGVTDADVKMVAEITDHYISSPRTICLAVISATNDHANQPILTKVRAYDPEGNRTLGIITKPDRLSAGSGSEQAFISLAKNEDVFFKLGWHVLKNRAFEEGSSSLVERNVAERTFFRQSNFKVLPTECVGIDALRSRLSHLLFEHVKQELPKLRHDLENALKDTQEQLEIMGNKRSTAADCKAYLMQLSLDVRDVCKAAVEGHYESEYFNRGISHEGFTESAPVVISRIRAVVQNMNTEFSEFFHNNGHKYHFNIDRDGLTPFDPNCNAGFGDHFKTISPPTEMSKKKSLDWVAHVLARTRGRELVGNYNPLLVGELFWEQSTKWEDIAKDHVDNVASQCSQFFKTLLHDKAPKDIEARLWDGKLHDQLKERSQDASAELARIMKDNKGYPINYNHYYTETIKRRRHNRQRIEIEQTVKQASQTVIVNDDNYDEPPTTRTTVDIDAVVAGLADRDQNMEHFSCQEALDCLIAIYKVCYHLSFSPLAFFLGEC